MLTQMDFYFFPFFLCFQLLTILNVCDKYHTIHNILIFRYDNDVHVRFLFLEYFVGLMLMMMLLLMMVDVFQFFWKNG